MPGVVSVEPGDNFSSLDDFLQRLIEEGAVNVTCVLVKDNRGFVVHAKSPDADEMECFAAGLAISKEPHMVLKMEIVAPQ